MAAFRAAALAWTAGAYSLDLTLSPVIRARAAAAGAAAGFATLSAQPDTDATQVTAAAASAAATTDPVAAASAAAATQAAATAVVDARDHNVDLYLAASADATQIEGEDSLDGIGSLADRPVWLESVPEWASTAWQEQKGDLLLRNECWDIWVEWYEKRILGPELSSEPRLEVILYSQPDTFWRQSVQTINHEITRMTRAGIEPS